MKYNRFFVSLAVFALFIVSCGKTDDSPIVENFEPHPTWTDDSTNNFWDKQQAGGFQIDTVWDGDTIISW